MVKEKPNTEFNAQLNIEVNDQFDNELDKSWQQVEWVLTDVDDTLTWQGALPPESLIALQKLLQHNIKVVAVTGACAGWCDHIAQLWPVDAVLGENGAFLLQKHAGELTLTTAQPLDVIRDLQAKLKLQIETILVDYPQLNLTLDQAYRLCEVAIDIGQNRPVVDPQIVSEILAKIHALGASMLEENKLAIRDLLASNQIPLLEDDVYTELYFSENKPKPIKAYDEQGLVLHCSSFSKCLAPGFRVGWVVAGRYAKQIEQLQLMSTLSAAVPNQLALAEYVLHGNYDAHLRRLRQKLQQRQQKMQAAIAQYFPAETKITRPEGGYFLWLELPEQVDSGQLLKTLLNEHNISIGPGTLFSSDGRYKHCMRINCSYPWTEKTQQALVTLARCIQQDYLGS